MAAPTHHTAEVGVTSGDIREKTKSTVVESEPRAIATPVQAAGSEPTNATDEVEIVEFSQSQPRVEASSEITEVNPGIQGHATVKYGDGSTYEGEWNSKREGVGKMTWRNGNIYQGDWKDDVQNGNGIMRYWDKSRYNGEWKNGQRHGKGEMTWVDGERYGGTHYQGDWREDKREGKGLLRDRHEGTYEGDWRDDRAEGFGKATWKNQNWYQGEVADGKPEGRGAYYHAATGRLVRGNFRGGNKIVPSCIIQ